MTKESLATLLNGREYRNEITDAEEAEAKAAGLVVLFGASDDLAELRGAIHDETDCINGGAILLVDGDLYNGGEECDCRAARSERTASLKRAKQITSEWCKGEGYSWTYSTDIPHATFDVMEDGEKYCRGIVFALADAR